MKLIRILSPVERGFEAFNQIASSLNVMPLSKVKGSISKGALEFGYQFTS